MKMDVLILAGGKSSRMGGSHKGNLKIGDETFQQHVIRTLSTFAEKIFLSYGMKVQSEDERCEILMDEIPDCGPMGGLAAGLKHGDREFLAVSPCDLPFIEASFYERLYDYLTVEERTFGKKYLAVIPVVEGKIHPLTAIYRKQAGGVFDRELRQGHYKVIRALELMEVLYMDLSEQSEMLRMLANINTPQEYEKLVESQKPN